MWLLCESNGVRQVAHSVERLKELAIFQNLLAGRPVCRVRQHLKNSRAKRRGRGARELRSRNTLGDHWLFRRRRGNFAVLPNHAARLDDRHPRARRLLFQIAGKITKPALAPQWQDRQQRRNEKLHFLYPILRKNPCRHSASAAVSTPLDDAPSITPSTPLPCSVWATITSTGFAVAQKIVQTSGVSRIRFFTLIGNPPRSATTNKCPAPTAARVPGRDRLQLFIVAIHARQTRARRFVERNPELHLRNAIDDGFVNILHRFNEMAVPDDNVAVTRNLHPDRLQVHANH